MPTNRTSDYRFGYSPDGLERLEHQHRVWAEDIQRLLAWAGFREGATLVDDGAPTMTFRDSTRMM